MAGAGAPRDRAELGRSSAAALSRSLAGIRQEGMRVWMFLPAVHILLVSFLHSEL